MMDGAIWSVEKDFFCDLGAQVVGNVLSSVDTGIWQNREGRDYAFVLDIKIKF